MRTSSSLPLGLALGAALLALGSVPATAAPASSPAYFRIVQGTASVTGQDGTAAAQVNQPLLAGDRLSTGGSAHIEVVLPDGGLLRIDGDTGLQFDRFADSGSDTLLRLDHGEVQLAVAGSAATRVDTDNATVYLRDAGSYRIAGGNGSTHVLVREGSAEVRTRHGAQMVEQDEEAWVEGEDGQVEVQAAGNADGLEHWAGTIEEDYRRANYDDSHVDASLGYSAATMASYGSWVSVDGSYGWRPRVAADWSPYRYGRWGYTPGGLTWVSSEPWGWVPYHYGTWNFAPGFGWVWYPGAVYAPAWVYWYWGPTYVGWCPIGYYSGYYGGYYGYGYNWNNFGWGVHGWAGGHHWDHWNFVDCHHVGDHRLAYYTRNWSQLGLRELPRGVIASDTRAVPRDFASRPDRGMQAIIDGTPGRVSLAQGRGRDLPDVSRFVARDPHADAAIVRGALPVSSSHGGNVAVSVSPSHGGNVSVSARPGIGVSEPRGVAPRGVEVAPGGREPRAVDGRGVEPRAHVTTGSAPRSDDWRGNVSVNGRPATGTSRTTGTSRPVEVDRSHGDAAHSRSNGYESWRGSEGGPTVGNGGAGSSPRVVVRPWRGPDGYSASGTPAIGATRSRDDESWRSSPLARGNEWPAVRRVVEGMRSSRPDGATVYGSPGTGTQVRPLPGSAAGAPRYGTAPSYQRPVSPGGGAAGSRPVHPPGGGASRGSAHESGARGGASHGEGGHAQQRSGGDRPHHR